MKNVKEILDSLASPTPSKWRERAEWRRDNKELLREQQKAALLKIESRQLAKQYFEFPLKDSGFAYIYTNNNKVAFNWMVNMEISDREIFIHKLNTGIGEFKRKFEVDNERLHIFSEDGQKVLLIRSWGRLTGTGGHNLSAEKAMEIQTAMLNYCCEQLNK